MAISIRRWRGRKHLTAKDLGLNEAAIDEDLFSLGQKHLVPPSALAQFAQLESRARVEIEKAGFPFLGMARYVPNEVVGHLLVRLEEMREEFETVTKEFIEQYEDIKTQAIERWKVASDKMLVDNRDLMRVVTQSFPSKSDLAAKFDFSWVVFQATIPGTDGVEPLFGAVRAKAAVQAREQIKNASRAFVEECVSRLREETADLCEDVLKTLQQTPAVRQNTLDRLTDFIDKFEKLNFANDVEMQQQLDTLRSQLKTAEDYRKNPETQRNLEMKLGQMRDIARTLASASASVADVFGEADRALGV
jgi:hypothetical protein